MADLSEALKFNGFDTAILGHGGQFSKPSLLVYSQTKIIETLRFRDGMTEEEAIEFFDFNIAGAWMGEGTPIIVDDYSYADDTGDCS